MRPRLPKLLVAAAAAVTFTGCGAADDSDSMWPPAPPAAETAPLPDVELDLNEYATRFAYRVNDPAITSEFLAAFDLNEPTVELAAGAASDVTFERPDVNQLLTSGWMLAATYTVTADPSNCPGGSGDCVAVGWSAANSAGWFADGVAYMTGPAGQRKLTVSSFCELMDAAGGTCR